MQYIVLKIYISPLIPCSSDLTVYLLLRFHILLYYISVLDLEIKKKKKHKDESQSFILPTFLFLPILHGDERMSPWQTGVLKSQRTAKKKMCLTCHMTQNVSDSFIFVFKTNSFFGTF